MRELELAAGKSGDRTRLAEDSTFRQVAGRVGFESGKENIGKRTTIPILLLWALWIGSIIAAWVSVLKEGV